MSDQVDLDELVDVLRVRQVAADVFEGRSPERSFERVFGGQVAGQALQAAGRTVTDGRQVHSLQGYFLRPGQRDLPINYQVERLRDGASFSARRVTARQQGEVIFALAASFQIDEPGVDHAAPMPTAPDPETLPTLAERAVLADGPVDLGFWSRRSLAVDIRYAAQPPWLASSTDSGPGGSDETLVWFRFDGELPDDRLLHVCLLTYLSDLSALDAVLAIHQLRPQDGGIQLASLDHAVWIHRPVFLDDWVLYHITSPSASGARGLGSGAFYSRDGLRLATVVQEGLVRQRY